MTSSPTTPQEYDNRLEVISRYFERRKDEVFLVPKQWGQEFAGTVLEHIAAALNEGGYATEFSLTSILSILGMSQGTFVNAVKYSVEGGLSVVDGKVTGGALAQNFFYRMT